MVDYAKLTHKMDLLDKLSYEKYGSYSSVCGLYSGVLKNLICGDISKEQAEQTLDYFIKKYQEEK